MARTDNDTWDITESVGATALGVAAARAAASEEESALIDDPFARVFLDAAGKGIWSYWGGALPEEFIQADPEASARMRAMVDYMACRTVYFDRFFLDAAAAGVRQVVILAAGLDARAWRLPWPDGTQVFELDQPKVLQFKSSTLQRAGAAPTATLVDIAVDLRQNWPKALQEHGFDTSAPSVWSAEGLLMFLPAQAQDLLFERIHALSAPGSRVAAEALSADMLAPDFLQRQREQMQRFRDMAAATMGDTEIPAFEDLWYLEERSDVADWLAARGWDAEVLTAAELMARHNRSVPVEAQDSAPRSLFVSARRRRAS
jgi:methyltransferase (TIGR00027 family)